MDIFIVTIGQGVLLASGQWDPGLLLSKVQDSSTTKNYPDAKMKGAEVEKPRSKGDVYFL